MLARIWITTVPWFLLRTTKQYGTYGTVYTVQYRWADWRRMNSLLILFVSYLKKQKFAFCVYGEYAHNGEKGRKTEHISVDNGPSLKIVNPFFLS